MLYIFTVETLLLVVFVLTLIR